MSDGPVVLKLGGDALASPARIVTQARRLARRAALGPVVAVASARRGVTDHLIELAEAVRGGARAEAPRGAPSGAARAEQDRAVASGEVVAASLLALALNEVGVPAVSLDAREAGVLSQGRFGGARIRGIIPRRVERLLARRIVPVVTGFQGWQRGRVATLGRGGTDTSAVALTLALRGARTVFVKEAAGLRTADPRLVPEAAQISEAPHAFLAALTGAGSPVVQAPAAALAETHGLPLEFWTLEGEGVETLVHQQAPAAGLRGIATAGAEGLVTAVAGLPAELIHEAEPLRAALSAAGVACGEIQPAANGLRFRVPAGQVGEATRALHDAFVLSCTRRSERRAS